MFLIVLIVTHNPDITTLRKSLLSIINFIDDVIIIDNASNNKESALNLCTLISNCEFLEVGFNSGIAHALRVGVNYAYARYRPEWFLFLDDDTIVNNKAMPILIEILKRIPQEVGLVRIYSEHGKCKLMPQLYGTFSGSFIKSQIALKVCCRDDFFLDQADFDMYYEIRKLGYKIIGINCDGVISHRIGTKVWIPIISNIRKQHVSYEPPWRLYYIARNSTVLLIEGKIGIERYTMQLIQWGLISLLKKPIKTIKALGLGLLHGIMKRLGFMSYEYLE